MDIAELDINAVCFGILCNFPQFFGEERAKEAAELVRALYAERETLRAALRPVSREQVWGVGAWETVADEGFVDTMGRQVFHLHCPVCDFFWRETGHKKYFRFCPACGAPMTDEAVEKVMERLEALNEM